MTLLKNTLPRLPAELTDMVIDQLWNDKAALSAASLVARTWLPRCRVHKFGQVRVETDFDGLRAHLENTPHLRPYVRKLVLQGPAYDADETEEAEEAVDGPMDVDTPRAQRPTLSPLLLADILALLPCLRELQLHHLSLHAPPLSPSPDLPLPPHTPRIIQTLTLMDVGSACADDITAHDLLLRVLALFADVGFLHLAGVPAHAWTSPPSPPPCAARTRVGALRLENAPGAAQYLHVLCAPGTLRALEAEVTEGDDAAALAELARGAGVALQRVVVDLAHCFRLEYYDEDADEVIISPCAELVAGILGDGLQECTGLRSAEFVVPAEELYMAEHGMYEPSHIVDAWECLFLALKQLPPATQELTIRLFTDMWEDQLSLESLDLDWDWLQRTLSHFDNLRLLRIGTAHDSEWALEPEDEEYLRRQMPVLHQKGVLHVEVGYSLEDMIL
ncbi:uncharacterized protein PHACADRAFT_264939 [Phanerochaete carnosa HHB-10118-sp]|uniref:F-box domain-containing protein n=1 Tax=Phanerochaete carnosa (strain HHB-10118-sp) TaxID=650164 RepID=K5VGL3_PHACS|nr:uncharacterized protein PHACADRAFT_264939 [Phanerochaete carnosa HHB-10118-sp]EKM50328.1 hypothetical protein PHACADRAFT_264939 [Phanerochaete carnosa HHB-10118-sp]